MDSATLRRLLADRDGGALSEDVEALLDAHVKLSPPAQSAKDEYSAVVRDVNSVLDPRVQAALPAFPRDAVTAALRTSSLYPVVRFRNRNRLMGLGAAACVVFAFFAGRISLVSRPTEVETQMQMATETPLRTETTGIWSLDARRRASVADSNSTQASYKWRSPLEWSVIRRS